MPLAAILSAYSKARKFEPIKDLLFPPATNSSVSAIKPPAIPVSGSS